MQTGNAARAAGCAISLGLIAAAPAVAQPVVYSAPRAQVGSGDDLGFYALPRTVVPVVITAAKGGFIVRANAPETRAGAYLPLSAGTDARFKDDFTFETDPKTGFFKKIEINSEDRSKAAIIALAKAAASLASGGVPEAATGKVADAEAKEHVVGAVNIDPTDAASIHAGNAYLWQAMDAFLKSRVGQVFCGTAEEACGQAKSRLAGDPAGAASAFPFFYAPARASMTPEALRSVCQESLCVRARIPVDVRVQAPAGPPLMATFEAADSSSVGLINIHRAAWVTKTGTIDFVDGSPTVRKLTKGSEFEAVATLPLEIIDAGLERVKTTLTALAEVAQLRINLVTKDKDYLAAEKDKLLAQIALEDERKKRADALTEAAKGKAEASYASSGKALLMSCSYDVNCDPPAPLPSSDKNPGADANGAGDNAGKVADGKVAEGKPPPDPKATEKPDPKTPATGGAVTPKPGAGAALDPHGGLS